jgi:hypothetical protein
MANLIIGFPNLISDATLSGGSWEASLPLTNLQDRRLAKKARTTTNTTAAATVVIDLLAEKPIRLFALVKNNLTSLDGTYRLRGSNDSGFATTEYDSGEVEVWAAAYETTDLEWEDDNFWDGKPDQEYIYDLQETSTLNLIHVLPSIVMARYWKLEITDPSNADGYIEAGRIFISSQWQVTNNIKYGASLGYETNTSVDESLDGTEYFDVRTAYRNFKFELESYDYNEGHSKLLDISRKVGVDKEVFVVPDPDDTANMTRRAFLGRLKTLSPLQYPYYNTNSAAYEVKEIV